MTDTVHIGRLQWRNDCGVIADGDTRYLVLRADSLMGAFAVLPPAERQLALISFANSVYAHGSQSLARYSQENDGRRDNLICTVATVAANLGWGRWTFAQTEHVISLRVLNSPFADGYGPSEVPVCHPVVGMFRALAEIMLGAPIAVKEVECAATGSAICRFEAILDVATS